MAVEHGKRTGSPPVLERFAGNPIIEPRSRHCWESKATFNPGALYDGGRVHLLYRAIGDMDVSVLGYASSSDGVHIEERLDDPVYLPRKPFEGSSFHQSRVSYQESTYVSGGGGMGGCEDPRLTKLDDTVYMTYTAFDGYGPPRVALTSILCGNFLTRNWQWRRPVIISPPGIIDKNACIFPEKIDGKYVILHRIYPDILIDFLDDLNFDGETRWLEGKFKISPRDSCWDSRKFGAGPPPIKTKEGWLLVYHGVGEQDPNRYKMGAMLFDLKDPTQVLACSAEPILEPQAWYENEGWKSGVVYPCGAAVIGDRLFVYYGGADKVVCVASAKLSGFLEQLVTDRGTIPVTMSATSERVTARKVKTERGGQVKAYCLKCRTKRIMKNARVITTKDGRPAWQGVCSVCGAKMFRFRKKSELAEPETSKVYE